MNFTDEEIQFLLKKYIRDKEYRRVYYNNKYKTDTKYRNYVRDYNKKRYEDMKLAKYIDRGGEEQVAYENRANNLKNYFIKNDRMEYFKTKYPAEYNLSHSVNVEATTQDE